MTEHIIQLVIPMAGDGTRFANAGYEVPKPLLPIHGRQMFDVVLSNLAHAQVKKAVLVAKAEWELTASVAALGKVSNFTIELVEIRELSEGPAHTVESAKPSLDMEMPLVIANSDQYLDYKFDEFYECLSKGEAQGAVLTMRDNSPKWSYASLDNWGHIISIVEKEVVSESATAGIYGFSKAKFFFDALDKMKLQDDRVNGEFYVGPVYNYLEPENGKVANFDMGLVGAVMHGLGTPDDFERFLLEDISHVASTAASNLWQRHRGLL